MRLPLWDLANTSGQASPTTGTDFIGFPYQDAIYRSVLDQTVAAVAAKGTLVGIVDAGYALNTAGANWSANITASYAYIRWMYGIVNAPATSTGSNLSKASVVIEGPAQALVVISQTTTLTPGYPLVSDGAGHLQGLGAAPASNLILALAMTTLNITATTTPVLTSLIPVWVEKGS